jgi:hypothetical protein
MLGCQLFGPTEQQQALEQAGVLQPRRESPEAAASAAFEIWAQEQGMPYQTMTYQVLTNDGTFATVRITAYFREAIEADWLENEAEIECRNVGGDWQCDQSMLYFALTPEEAARQAVPTARALPTPEPTSIPGATLFGFGYQTKSTGDGWAVGEVMVAFRNDTSSLIYQVGLDANGAYVETEEGATYPAFLREVGDQGADAEFLGEPMYFDEDYRGDPQFYQAALLPPGFRIRAGEAYPHVYRTIYFRVAEGTHPTLIRFPYQPHDEIELSASEAEPAWLTQDQLDNLHLFEELSGQSVPVQASAAVTFVLDGKCIDKTIYPNSHLGKLTYTVTNNDSLYQQEVDVWPPFHVMLYDTGAMEIPDWERSPEHLTLGPAQTMHGGFRLYFNWSWEYDAPPDYIVMEGGPQGFTVYKVVCTPE